MKKSQGFTLVELMLVVAVLGILAAMATPSFIHMIKDRQLRTAAEDVYNTFRYARAEAIRSSKLISIQLNNSSDWSDGFQVLNRDGETLRVHSAKSGIAVGETSGVYKLAFNGKGYVVKDPVELQFCNGREQSKSYQVNVFGSGFTSFKSIEGC